MDRTAAACLLDEGQIPELVVILVFTEHVDEFFCRLTLVLLYQQ